jgi:hypothetical protein
MGRPGHNVTIKTLRDALDAVAAEDCSRTPSTPCTYSYLSADMEDLPQEVVQPLLRLLPEACLDDKSFFTAQAATDMPPCRGLMSHLWVGQRSVSTAAHYDFESNLFVQVVSHNPPRSRGDVPQSQPQSQPLRVPLATLRNGG